MKLLIFLILCLYSSIVFVSADEIKIDNTIAIVNNQVILKSDVNQILLLMKKDGQNVKIPLRRNFVKDQVIQKLIIDALMLSEADKMNIKVTEEQVNDFIKSIAFKEHMTVDQLKENIILNNANTSFSYDDYIQKIKKLLKIQMIQDHELYKRVFISENEINFLFKKFIENNNKLKKINFSYIFLPFLKENTENIMQDKKHLAEKMINKLKYGYKFEKLYSEYKEKNNSILLKNISWMYISNAKKMFSNNFQVMKKGQILGPFIKDKGIYIVKINDVKNHNENILTEFYVQHCFIKPSTILSDSEAKKNIFKIYKNIQKRVYSFDYAVKNLSHDFNSSNKKGELGWISNGFFYGDLNYLFMHSNRQQISEPIQSHFGWHIIRFLDKRQVDQFYKDKRDYVYNLLLNTKMKLEKDHWIEDLKRMSYIKIIKQ